MTLDPRPIGWFAVARSDELTAGDARDGVLAAARYRLGRRRDGGLWFGGGIGAVAEQNGFILGWHHPGGAPPSWHVPALDEAGWRPLRHTLLHARTHPQEVFENSIDLGHFPTVHGYTDIAVLQPMRLDGHQMRVGYRIARHRMVARFEVHLHGIGCAHNHIEVPAVGLRVRMFALATPTEPGRVDIRLGVTVARSWSLPLARAVLPLVHRGVARSIVDDFRQDLAVWEHKRYLRPPLLVKGDGPIEGFRRWAHQFSAAPAAATAAAEVAP